MIYLASPYTSPSDAVQDCRFASACAAAARLMQEGHIIFSPIVHSHSVAQHGDLPAEWAFWRPWCIAMLDKADELWVLQLGGWVDSVGVQAEIKHAFQTDKPVRMVNPATLYVSFPFRAFACDLAADSD